MWCSSNEFETYCMTWRKKSVYSWSVNFRFKTYIADSRAFNQIHFLCKLISSIVYFFILCFFFQIKLWELCILFCFFSIWVQWVCKCSVRVESSKLKRCKMIRISYSYAWSDIGWLLIFTSIVWNKAWGKIFTVDTFSSTAKLLPSAWTTLICPSTLMVWSSV